MEPLSEDLTKDDLLQSGWESVMAECGDKECFGYSTCFGVRAWEAQEAGDARGQQIFGLLRDVTSMYLKLDSPEDPFGAKLELREGRTAIVEDFDEGRLKLLGEVVTDVNDPELKARIADVLCVRRPDFKMAGVAVSSYIESAKRLETLGSWAAVVDRAERALQLATRWGRNSDRFTDVTGYVEGALAKYDGGEPPFLSMRLMQLLQDRGVGDPTQNVTRAEKLALSAEAAGDWDRARECWEIKARWHFMSKDNEQARAARVRAAETYVKTADAALQRNPPSYMHAAAFVHFAIQAFRRIENTRARVRELHWILLEYQEKSGAEMVDLSSGETIPGDVIKYAIDRVKGKPLPEALLSLATIRDSPTVADLRAQAQENRKKYLFQRIMPNLIQNGMGRTVARQSQDEEGALLEDMYSDASIRRSILVQAFVEPARQQLVSEHYARARDFLPLILNNPFVRPGRELIIARGLQAGLQGDFPTAVHFLIPQLEESIRYVLFQLGVITSGLDDEGTQDEYNLNRLLSASEYSDPLVNTFGEDFVFDLRGLLVERFGANLRNELAHGLISHNGFYSVPAYYLWWLSLQFYSLPTVSKLREEQEAAGEGEAGS